MMPIFVSKTADRGAPRAPDDGAAPRRFELAGLLLVSFLLSLGGYRVYRAKAAHPERPSFAQVERELADGRIVALNELTGPEQLEPLLTGFAGEERRFAAEAIYAHARAGGFALPNAGELARARVDRARVAADERLSFFRERLNETIERERGMAARPAGMAERLRALLGPARPQAPKEQFAPFGSGFVARIKPRVVVRRPAQFTRALGLWGGLLLAVFFIVHLVWRRVGFAGDPVFLPVIQFLCGLGFLMMVSLRDPLRDTLSLRDFSLGVAVGCGTLLCASLRDRLPGLRSMGAWLKRRPDAPLAAALGLSALLVLFGSGPAGSDARVNLGPLQPVEFIKILIVFYLAGYLARYWEALRFLRQGRSGLFALLGRINAPRLVFFLPVMIAMGLALIFFFLQRDLGPALILGGAFLSLYAAARSRYALIVGGLAILAGGLTAAYRWGRPETVVRRIDIYRDVWENSLRGGDQIAHSLWAFATGGLTGTGLGLGDPAMIPAGHTDLILASIGEELGFLGFALVLSLYGLLIARSVRAAMRAGGEYELFLALGLTLITAWQIVLISAGILGLFPLSGVVSPFLSWGKSSMIANFLIAGLILGVSAGGRETAAAEPFRAPVRRIAAVLACLGAVITGVAGYYQILRADETVLRGALVELRDGSYQFQYNPRLLQAAARLRLGTIRDRNGIPLAVNDCRELDAHRDALSALGVRLDTVCKAPAPRIYPFGDALFHLLGDLNTRRNWAARNTNYVERDYGDRLRGYDDHARTERLEEVLNRRVAAVAPSRSPRPFVEPDKDVEAFAGVYVAGESAGSAVAEEEESVPTAGVQRYVVRRDLRELLALLRYRYRPDHPAMRGMLDRSRDLRLTIDVRLQLKVSELLARRLGTAAVRRGAVVALDPATGDVLAAVSYPWPGAPVAGETAQPGKPASPVDELPDELVDRAFTGLRPPGSTFKLVTAAAALDRADADFRAQQFRCDPLGDGRVGARIPGYARAVRDSEGDQAHGAPDLETAIAQSCNAYFAQLGVRLGAEQLKTMADRFEIRIADSIEELREGENLPQAAYGQGRVVATPFQMARVAAAIANGGRMAQGRWVQDESNRRAQPPTIILSEDRAAFLLRAMRAVVTTGTARRFAGSAMAGKTGTAQVSKRVRMTRDGRPGFRDADGRMIYLDANAPLPAGAQPAYRMVKQAPHAWFVGVAPYDAPRRVAFSVLIENGGYGGAVAAPLAEELVAEARRLGLIP
ncbi:MAG: FtsW/RodA/SpoVE family cell cycle protein [Blastocatellia bacterium]|nr:FtsW/RodA/SpoVE family cell cycle protein [Blastocatellia bacterium]